MADIPATIIPTIPTYEELRTLVVIRPPVSGPSGRLLQSVYGRFLDANAARTFDAINARKPSDCPSDGLYLLGSERGIEQFGASDAVYRERLRTAWTTWVQSGTRGGTTTTLTWIDLPNTSVFRRAEWSYPPPAGSKYVQAAARDDWDTYDILVRQPQPWTVKRWGDWFWGDGTVWALSATPDEIASLRRLVRTYASGHEMPVYAHIRTGWSAPWGDWRWGDGRRWATRPATSPATSPPSEGASSSPASWAMCRSKRGM